MYMYMYIHNNKYTHNTHNSKHITHTDTTRKMWRRHRGATLAGLQAYAK